MKPDPKDLCDVVKEISAALLEADWARYESESGQYYYVVRHRDYAVEIEGGRAFDRKLSFPRPEDNAFWNWYIRAALAEEPLDRLADARKRAGQTGVASGVFDEAILASSKANTVDELRRTLDPFVGQLLAHDRFEALIAVLSAVRIERVRQGHLFISEVDRAELRQAVEIRFLKELAERYPKAVKRATTFDWLSFSDPQLREASRCYLYGFMRAAVLIAVAALESRLRDVCVGDRNTKYDALADLAFGKAGVAGPDPARAAALKDAFRLRNEIAHERAEAAAVDAEKVLLLVRSTLEELSRFS